MYDFQFHMVGPDVRFNYREEVDHPWLPENRGALTISKLPLSPPPLQEISPFEKWGMDGGKSFNHTLASCLSLFLQDDRSAFSRATFDAWNAVVASIPSSYTLVV